MSILVDEFVADVAHEVSAKSIYVWGGQGEKYKTTTLKTIEGMEEGNEANVKRILKHVADIYPVPDDCRMFDCSGLLTFHLIRMGILSYDTTANGLYHKCRKITKKELKPGDFVFKVTDADKAVHVAMYYNDNTLVECVGRDEGVQFTKLTSKFNKYGRLPQFA